MNLIQTFLMIPVLVISTFNFEYSANKNVSQNERVFIKDLSNERLELGIAFAKKNSGGQLVLHYMGNDKANMKVVYQALSKAKIEGSPVGGMVISSPNSNFKNGTECYSYYLQGICLTKIPVDATLKTEWLIRNYINYVDSTSFKSPVETH